MMKSVTSRPALFAALLATSAISSPALADNPKYRNWDENGVDLVQGDYRLTFAEGSIGSGNTELALIRVNNSDAFSQWDQLALTQTTVGSDVTTRVTMPDGADEVFLNGANLEGTGSSIIIGASIIYEGRDGTKVEFYNPVPGPGTEFCPGASPCKLLPKTITYPSGRTITFVWTVVGTGTNHASRIESITNSDSYSIVFTYQSNTPGAAGWGRRSSSVFKNGATAVSTIGYAYPIAGTTDVTDPTNHVWRITDTSIRRPTEGTPGFSISATSGIVTSVTADGVTTTYGRSLSGNVVTLTKTTAGNATVITSDLAIDRIKSIKNPVLQTTTITHDTLGRITKITAPEGNSAEYVLDERGNPTQTKFRPKTGSASPALSYASDFSATCDNEFTCNQATSIQDPAGIAYTFGYSPTGQMNSRTAPAVNGVAAQERWNYQTINGIRELNTNRRCQTANLNSCLGTADEITTTYTYGANANVTGVTTGDSTGTLSASQTMTYDAAANLLTVDGPLPGTADTTRYRYDAARRLVGEISPDPDGAGILKHRAVRTTYDAAGRVTKVERGTVDSQSDPDWALFAPLEAVDIGYDSNSRAISQKLSSGGVTYAFTQLSYDSAGRLQCRAVRMNPAEFATPPASACALDTEGSFGPDRLTRYYYTAAGQHSKTLVGYHTADEAYEVIKLYTNNGRLRSLVDAEDNRTDYSYDEYDRFSKTQYPVPTQGAGVSSTTDYEQVAYDNRSNVTSRRLRDGTSIAYTIDAMSRVIFKNLPGSEPDVTYTYDNLSRLTSASQTGNSLSFTYDALSRNLTQVGPQGTVSSQWDIGGRRTKLTYPGTGLFVDYDHLVTGEMTKIRENGSTSGVGVLATLTYDNLGRRTLLTFGNGASQAYGFDPVSRLASLTNNLTGTTNDLSATFANNPASQIASTVRTGDAYAWTGHFNTNVTGIANGLNQLTSVGPKSLTHDTRGNVTAFGTKSFTYSSENLLLTGPGSTTLGYDPAMRLYQSVSGATTQRFAYDGLDRIAEYNGSNGLQRRYVHGPNMDEPLVWYEGTGTADRRFLGSDERGSIISVTNSLGTVLQLNKYDEYGNPQSANLGAFGYTGQTWLPTMGIWYYKARVYDPELGRFLQTDPIDVAGGINLYAYVSNDPVNFTDPLGLGEEPCLPPRCDVVTGRRSRRELEQTLLDARLREQDLTAEAAVESAAATQEEKEKICRDLTKKLQDTKSSLSDFITKFPNVWNNVKALEGHLNWIQGDLDNFVTIDLLLFGGDVAAGVATRSDSKLIKRIGRLTSGVSKTVGRLAFGIGVGAEASLAYQAYNLNNQVKALQARIAQINHQKAGICN